MMGRLASSQPTVYYAPQSPPSQLYDLFSTTLPILPKAYRPHPSKETLGKRDTLMTPMAHSDIRLTATRQLPNLAGQVTLVSLTVIFFILSFLTPSFAQAPKLSYDYPFTNPFAATVVGTPNSYAAELPKDVPVRIMDLEVFPDREVPDILWYNRELRYSLAPQEGSAPLIFVIAGTGAGFNSPKMQVLQGALYGEGFHVVSISSPTHPNFITAASTSGIPGHLLEDSQDLYRVMRLIWLQIQEEEDVEVTDFHLTGYSLGAAQAAFLAKLDDEQGDFGFKKVLMINPPVSLYKSTSILDEMLVNNIPGGIDKFPDFFDRAFHAFSKTYTEGDFVNFGGDFLYHAYKENQPADEDLAALIGTSFRISASSMIFTADVVTNAGYIKPKNLELSTGDSVTDFFKVSGRISFLDYFRELFTPYFQNKYPDITEQTLIDNLSLNRLERFLRTNPHIGLVHNADDIILAPGELNYLEEIFGERAKIYPYGGHCGNLAYKDNIAYLVQFFQSSTSIEKSTSVRPSSLLHPDAVLPHTATYSPDDVASIMPYEKEYSHSPATKNPIDLSVQLTIDIHVLEARLQRSRQDLEKTKMIIAALQAPQPDPFLIVSAGSTNTDAIEPAQRSIDEVVRPGVRFLVDIYDPIESFNRHIYKFNAKFDEYVFLPVVEGYEAITPDYVEDRISNFFNNIADIRNLINSILQLKGTQTLKTLTRFLINTTVGIAGFWDHATSWGFPQQQEDFGQTLGHYGLNPGPYIVLPIFGPSSARDTTGLVVDSAARFFYLFKPLGLDEQLWRSSAYTVSNAIDTRHQLKFRYYQTGSPFEYDLIRLLYKKMRELEIEK